MLAALVAVAFVHLWTHAESGWFLAIPTVARGIVYEGTTLGDVLALDERDGRVRWRASLGANPDETYGNPRGVISSIALSAGVAYAVSGSCKAGAFDAFNGALRWKRRICSLPKNDDTYASPVVAGGRVLFGIDVIADRPTDTGREVALDAATGEPAWSFTPVRYRGTGGGVSTTPAVDAARRLVVIGTGNPTPMTSPPPGPDPYTDSAIAVDPRTGRWRWVTGPLIPHDANDFDVFASPRLLPLRIGARELPGAFVVLKDSRCVMLDERNGKILWQRALEPSMHWMQAIGTPAVSGDTIVVPLFHGAQIGELVALRAEDGAVLWRAQTPGIYEAPVIWRKTVVVAEAKGAVAAFALDTGKPLAELPIPSVLYGHGLALDGDRLFIGGRGALWAYRLEQ
jgi:polyvinyl alcohol dehydrogenase (cytochrome)